MYKLCSDPEHKCNVRESNCLRVRKEKATLMGTLNCLLVRKNQKFIIPFKDKLYILVSEGNDRAIVKYNVVKECVSLVYVLVCLASMPLQSTHSYSP